MFVDIRADSSYQVLAEWWQLVAAVPNKKLDLAMNQQNKKQDDQLVSRDFLRHRWGGSGLGVDLAGQEVAAHVEPDVGHQRVAAHDSVAVL